MNAPMMLRHQRLSRISQIVDAINKLIEEKKTLKYSLILNEMITMLGISKKTAIEYLDVALYQLNILKEEIQ